MTIELLANIDVDDLERAIPSKMGRCQKYG